AADDQCRSALHSESQLPRHFVRDDLVRQFPAALDLGRSRRLSLSQSEQRLALAECEHETRNRARDTELGRRLHEGTGTVSDRRRRHAARQWLQSRSANPRNHRSRRKPNTMTRLAIAAVLILFAVPL